MRLVVVGQRCFFLGVFQVEEKTWDTILDEGRGISDHRRALTRQSHRYQE